jgi:hypothetical protein
MSCNDAVVITKPGENEELCFRGKTYLLVNAEESNVLTHPIIRVLSETKAPEKLRELGLAISQY